MNIFIAVYKTALSAEKDNQINLRLSFVLRLTGLQMCDTNANEISEIRGN